ncbi:AAA family ATPase [Streptomyces sp. NPDC102259]|uniref:AAA family ATPase n=1 Tax=Streptomyces sp. NPDC102259 TaxID=3366148 RepID=UPI0037FE3556
MYGRRQEQAALDRILDAARQGRGATMVLWGDPGVGKTALLESAAGSAAADFTVLRCGGTRLGSGLTFAALHELLRPVTERIGTLPEPQANALNGAPRPRRGRVGRGDALGSTHQALGPSRLLPSPVDGGGGPRAAFC